MDDSGILELDKFLGVGWSAVGVHEKGKEGWAVLFVCARETEG